MVKNSIFLSHYTEKPHLEYEPIFTTPQLKIKYNTRIQDIFDIYMEYYHNTIPTALEEKIFLLIDETHYDKNWARFAKTLYPKMNTSTSTG